LALATRKANPIILDFFELFYCAVLQCSRHHLFVATSTTASGWLFLGFFCGLGFFFHGLVAFFLGQPFRAGLFYGLLGSCRVFFPATATATGRSRTAFLVGTNCAVFFATSTASGQEVAGSHCPDGSHQGRDAEAGENLLQFFTIHCILLCLQSRSLCPSEERTADSCMLNN
jgi:hypothetical protein